MAVIFSKMLFWVSVEWISGMGRAIRQHELWFRDAEPQLQMFSLPFLLPWPWAVGAGVQHAFQWFLQPLGASPNRPKTCRYIIVTSSHRSPKEVRSETFDLWSRFQVWASSKTWMRHRWRSWPCSRLEPEMEYLWQMCCTLYPKTSWWLVEIILSYNLSFKCWNKDQVKSLIFSILLGILLVIGVFIVVVHRITEENREYFAKWSDGQGDQTVGTCDLWTCRCASIHFFAAKWEKKTIVEMADQPLEKPRCADLITAITRLGEKFVHSQVSFKRQSLEDSSYSLWLYTILYNSYIKFNYN